MKNINKLLLLLTSFALFSCGGNSSSLSSTSKSETVSSLGEANPTYTVNVVYEDNTPVKEGEVTVQFCEDAICYTPIAVDSDGKVTTNNFEKKNYFIHLLEYPEGYAYDPNIYTLSDTVFETTVVLEKLTSYTQTGSEADPIEVSEGCYHLSFEKGEGSKYFSYTASEDKEITISSRADVRSIDAVDPCLTILDHQEDNTDGVNFVYKFNVTNGQTYNFSISASARFYPAEFTIVIK